MPANHKIIVIAHSGYRGDERPVAVVMEEERYDVVQIEDSWIASGMDSKTETTRGFVVRCAGGPRFKLICGEKSGWRGEFLPGPRLVQ